MAKIKRLKKDCAIQEAALRIAQKHGIIIDRPRKPRPVSKRQLSLITDSKKG